MDSFLEVFSSSKWPPILMVGISVSYITYLLSPRIIDWIKFNSIGTKDYVSEKLALMFIDVPSHHIVLAQIAMSLGLGLLSFLLFIPNWIPGLIFATIVVIAGWLAPRPIVNWMYRKRVKQFVIQMVDALDLMSNGLRSGLSIVQAIALAVEEMPNPLKQEFQLVLSENKLGVTLEDAFTSLSKRVQSDDVEMFVTSINILKETGGNLAETFDTIVYTIRERIRIEQKIEGMTAQGFAQGMVLLGIAPALGTILYFSDPEYLQPLFTETMGWIILAIILTLLIIGFFLIMYIIKIEV